MWAACRADNYVNRVLSCVDVIPIPRPALRGIPERQVHPSVRGEDKSKSALRSVCSGKAISMGVMRKMRPEMRQNTSRDVVGLSRENASCAKPGSATRDLKVLELNHDCSFLD